MNASCTAENRTYHVIVAHFHSEIKKPLSVALTLKAPAHDTFCISGNHLDILVDFDMHLLL